MSKGWALKEIAKLEDATMDLFTRQHPELVGQIERDKGLQKVSLNNPNFMDKALDELAIIKRLMPNEEFSPDGFTGEDIRNWLSTDGIQPDHSNAWGALIMTAIKRGIIVPTGSYTSMKSKTSHARKTAVYRWA